MLDRHHARWCSRSRSSVELVGPLAGGKPPAGKLWTIAKTTPTAWKQTGMFFFSPTTKIEEGKEKGSYGARLRVPGPAQERLPVRRPPRPGMSAPDQANTPPSESKKPVRLLVIGDSDFASDEYLQLGRYLPIYQEGAQMLFNAMGWATEDEALTPVRTKTLTARPIQVESRRHGRALQVVNVAGRAARLRRVRRRALARPRRAPPGPETLTVNGPCSLRRPTLELAHEPKNALRPRHVRRSRHPRGHRAHPPAEGRAHQRPPAPRRQDRHRRRRDHRGHEGRRDHRRSRATAASTR